MIEKILERLEEEALQAEKDMGLSDAFAEAQRCGDRWAAYEKAYKIVQEVAKEYGNGWIPTEKELPPHSDELLLVQCNGKTRNVVFENAFCLASYTEEGWILEMYPEWENPDVVAWQRLPNAPYQKGEQYEVL